MRSIPGLECGGERSRSGLRWYIQHQYDIKLDPSPPAGSHVFCALTGGMKLSKGIARLIKLHANR